MNINIDEIESIIHNLLSELRQGAGNEIELDCDYYWDIPIDEIYNPYKEPATHTLGQLTDDLLELQNGNKRNNLVVYDLKKAGALLNFLSTKA